MNYFEHHIGDYAAATAHLSWDEDMAYSRLLRWYYQHEKPLPAEPVSKGQAVLMTTPGSRYWDGRPAASASV